MPDLIKIRKSDPAHAPTPQNTPSVTAPISSHAEQPSLAKVTEETIPQAPVASIKPGDPRLLSMIQGRLGSLVGRSSGYVESFPVSVRERLSGLKGIQQKHSILQGEFQKELLLLEKQYQTKFMPLYDRRAKIISGVIEPSEEEIKVGKEMEEEEEENDEKDDNMPKVEINNDPGADVKGISEFWLSAMKTHISLAEMITPADEEALKHITDISMEYLDRPGFRLIFEFSENEFFENKQLTKTYYYQEENGYGGDFIYDHAEGDQITWKTGKDLTIKVESKKQRNRSTKQTRIVKKTVPTESFFNFFYPPKPPSDEEEDDISDIEVRLELDYQLGEDIKEKIIPHAVDWFTGEVLRHEKFAESLETDFDEEDEDEDGLTDEEAESDDEHDESKQKPGSSDCKQS